MNTVPIHPYLSQIVFGTLTTIELVVAALVIGVSCAIILTFGASSQKKYLTWPINAFTFVIRGTPLLVQFFIIYFGSAQFEWVRNSIFWIVLQKPFTCAIITLAINTCAYTTVLFTGAVKSVPHSEVEACKALGMSWLLMMRRVIFPRAFRIALPAYSNEVVMVLKGSSLASTITVLDLMGVTQRIIAETYAAIEFLLLAGAIYFVLNALLIGGFRIAEQKLNVYRGY